MHAGEGVVPEFTGTARFSLLRRLGAGGMGVVYEALDHERSARVALKTLRHLDAAAIYHLKQEFRALADVQHPNLVRLHDLVCDGGQWFFTMELVDGVDLLRWVRPDASAPVAATLDALPSSDGSQELVTARNAAPRTSGLRMSSRLDVARLRASMKQLATGLSALHATGKLHRDVKPSNVVVTHDGRVVLLDFGLATELHRDGTLHSLDQQVLGTPEYMSPEQGAARALGPSSDWYSVGVVLFEALTGGLPFLGTPLEVLMAKDRGDGPSPGSVVEGVPDDLDRLCAELLRRDPNARPTGDEIVRRLGTHSDAPPPPSAMSAGPMSAPISMPSAPSVRRALVGRDGELAALDAAFKRARQGRAVLVHLHGPAGVGKSALLRAFFERAQQERALVLSGACYERESVPYKALDAVVDALSRHLRRLSKLQAEALLPRDVHAALRLFPVLGRVEAIAAAPGLPFASPDLSELRRRAFAAMRELLARIGDRRPLVIAIDDLQWGDLDSVALLGDLLRPPYPPPLLLLASYRDEDAAGNPTLAAMREIHAHEDARMHEPMPMVVDLRASSTARRRRRAASCEVEDVAVSPLSSADAERLAAELAFGDERADGDRASAIAREAAGNPFLIVEYARFVRESPERARDRVTLETVIDARLGALERGARRLLDVLAVAARPLPLAVAARAAEIEEERAAVTALRDRQLVRAVREGDGEALEVWHDRIREIVAARVRTTTNDVADVHLRLARAIEAAHLDDPEGLALHFRAAGAKWKASHYAALAARKAGETLAFDRAASLYRLAIELAPPNAPEIRALRVACADALVDAGRGTDAAKEYLHAAQDAEPPVMLELHRRAAQQLLQSGHVDRGLEVFDGVLGVIGERVAKTPRRALASLFFRRAQLRLRGLEHQTRDEKQLDRTELARIDTLWALATGFGLVDTIVGMDFGTRHLIAALKAGEPYRLVRAFSAEAVFSASAGAPSKERTTELLDIAKRLAEQAQNPHGEGLAIAAEGFLHYHLGEWRRARELFKLAEKVFRERCAGVAWELANVRHFHLGALAAMGALRRLGDRLPMLLEEASARGDLLAQTTMRVGQGSILWLAHDDPDGGRRDVEDAVTRWSRRGFLLQHWYELAALAQFELYAGEAEAAHARVLERWPALERSLLLRVQRVRLDAWALRARTALAARSLRDAERAAARIEKEHMAWATPLSLAIRAAVAHTAGDVATAQELLKRASSGFDAADMKLYARAAQRRLGQLLGGDEGRAHVIAADVWMNGEEVQDPARMTATLLPGF